MSSLGFGTAQIGNLYRTVTDQEAFGTLQAAADAGITLFDTAPFYGHGLSELRLGQFLRTRPRASYVLSSKVGIVMTAPTGARRSVPVPSVFAAPLQSLPNTDYSRAGTLRSLEQSHLRLGGLHLDIALIHDLDRRNHGEDFERQFRIAVEGAIPALHELKRSGDVGAIGIAVNEPAVGVRLLADMDIDYILLAGCYTLLDQSGLDALLPSALARGIRVIQGSVFNSGILATGSGAPGRFRYADAPAEVVARVRAFEAICARHAIALPAVALRFAASHPAVVSVLVGASQPANIERSVATMKLHIPAEVWHDIRNAGLVAPGSTLPL